MLSVHQIKSEQTYEWLLKRHYAKRIPHITYSFGLFDKADLIGVVTYGSPPSPSLAKGLCGEKYKCIVRELNRLCLLYNRKNEASFLVSHSLKLLPKPSIVVSYADTSMNHNGYVYQATNFIYTGVSKKRSEWRLKGSSKHSKTLCEQVPLEIRLSNPDKYEFVNRPQKHRYVFFVASKKDKKQLIKSLNYPIEDYPKNKNINYVAEHKPTTQMNMFS